MVRSRAYAWNHIGWAETVRELREGSSQVSGHFVQGLKGKLLVVVRRPVEPTGSGFVLVVPPFAEEMNRCRRMLSDASIELARCGVGTVIPDLYGTGDSEGDFSDAAWSCWRDDLRCVNDWCCRCGDQISGVLGVRLGAALAVDLEAREMLPAVRCTVFWQPVFDGSRFLSQFLRLRIAAGLMELDRRESQDELRDQLRRGQTLEVAGYRLSGLLAADLEAIRPLDNLPDGLGEVHWMETVRDVASEMGAQSARLVGQWTKAGRRIQTHRFLGEPFWASTEIVRIKEMVDATTAALSRACHERVADDRATIGL